MSTQPDTNIQVIEIATEFLAVSKYDKLIKQLEEITESKFPQCLLNINYISTYEDKQMNSNCICGHAHLKYVNLMETHNHVEFPLGNICIGNILNDIKENDMDLMIAVINHIESIYNKAETATSTIQEANKRESYLNCKRCNKKAIKPNYDYKNEIKKHFCGGCVSNNQIICVVCNTKTVKFEKDYKGNYKIKCFPCWKNTK